MKQKNIKNYYLFYGLTTFLFLVFLSVLSYQRYNQFKNYHKDLASSSTEGLANQISNFIVERNRLVALFANNYREDILKFIENPDDIESFNTLDKKIKTFFPHYFAFTITDLEGKAYFIDFDDNVGSICLQDLKNYSQSKNHKHKHDHVKQEHYYPYIHPNPNAYHFDVMHQFNFNGKEGILLISFHADLLSQFIKSSQAPNHQTILAKVTDRTLIEVYDIGPRIKVPRNDYRTTDEETDRILSNTPVKNTQWHAIDLRKENYFKDELTSIILQFSLIAILIIIIISTMLYLLIRDERLLQQAQQQKDDFLAMMNHELRTPLTGIIGSLELIEDGTVGEISDDVRKFINTGLTSSHRLLNLINDMLDLDKLIHGTTNLNLQPVNIIKLIQHSLEQMQSYAEKMNVSLTLQNDVDTDFTITIDKEKIEQVLQNLISNACKYGADDDNIIIAIKKQANKTMISVTDHGEGIPEEYHATLFDKYTTTHSKLKENATSTGLGLNIAKAITEQHKGNLYFTSEKNSGTTFTLVLPTN